MTRIICKILDVPADDFKINVIQSDIGINKNVVKDDIVAENDEYLLMLKLIAIKVKVNG